MGHIHRSLFSKKCVISLAIPTVVLLFLFFFPSESPLQESIFSKVINFAPTDPCSGRYIYMYDLPTRFNSDILHKCKTLLSWRTDDLCPYIANSGMGISFNSTNNVIPQAGWFITDQFFLEIIFHSRMKQYPCRTTNSSIAVAVYVPFYAGLDIMRNFWWGCTMAVRDSLSLDLARWLKSRPEWRLHGGRDHFIVSGWTTSSDYRRRIDTDKSTGNKLMLLPEIKNFTMLAVESDPSQTNEVAIPYPTNFHPSSERQITSWQETIRSVERPWLFSFAGERRPNQTTSIRDQLIDQCAQSNQCKHIRCGLPSNSYICRSPNGIIDLFSHSKFCLEPVGDTPTRRSTFDSILAGCIPVFFHPDSAYTQYIWHFPKNETEYSVFIPEEEVRKGKVSIEEVLLKYSNEQVRDMRETLISMIPSILYKDSRHELESVKDAFDVAIDGIIERVTMLKGGGNQ